MHTNSATLPIRILSASLTHSLPIYYGRFEIIGNICVVCTQWYIAKAITHNRTQYQNTFALNALVFILLFSRYLLLLPRITLNVLGLLILHQTPLFLFLLYCHFFGLFANLTCIKPFLLARSHRLHSLLATFSEITGAPNLCFNTPNTCNYPFNIVEIFSECVRSPSQKVMFSNLDMLLTCCVVLFATSIYAMTQISQPLRTNNIWYSFRQLAWRDTRWKNMMTPIALTLLLHQW